MPNFGDRLRSQRHVLGMSQQEMADACGIGLGEQLAYESGRRGPDVDYLSALSKTGADLPYLLSGEPSVPVPQGISRQAWAFLDNFRHCDAKTQREIEALLVASRRINPGPHPIVSDIPVHAEVFDLARARRGRMKP